MQRQQQTARKKVENWNFHLVEKSNRRKKSALVVCWNFFLYKCFMFVAFAATKKKFKFKWKKSEWKCFFFICWENSSFLLCVLCAMHICELGNSMRNVFNINTLEALGVVYSMFYAIYICIRGCSTSGYVIYISFIQHRVVHGFAGGKIYSWENGACEWEKEKIYIKSIIIIFATYLPDTYVHDYVINGECRVGKISFNL